jgi:hypothetical protein
MIEFLAFLLAAVGAYVLPDWGTRALTAAERKALDELQSRLLIAAAKCEATTGALEFLESLHVRSIFKRSGDADGDSESETRAGRFARIGTRTILRADFFDADSSVESRFTSLLHEAYHAHTRDFTDEISYDWAAKTYALLKDEL